MPTSSMLSEEYVAGCHVADRKISGERELVSMYDVSLSVYIENEIEIYIK